MRRCLFYFTLFPQDFDIPERKSTTLWVVEDIYDATRRREWSSRRCYRQVLAFGDNPRNVLATKKKINGNVKTIRLLDARRQYWLSKAQQATFLRVHTIKRPELSLGTNMTQHLVDHLDKKDISFDHIDGGHNTSSTSFILYHQDILSFMSFDTPREREPGEEVGNFLQWCISKNCFLLLRMLDLENVFELELPEALGKLTRLKYLSRGVLVILWGT